jgi:hypothetical protein
MQCLWMVSQQQLPNPQFIFTCLLGFSANFFLCNTTATACACLCNVTPHHAEFHPPPAVISAILNCKHAFY